MKVSTSRYVVLLFFPFFEASCWTQIGDTVIIRGDLNKQVIGKVEDIKVDIELTQNDQGTFSYFEYLRPEEIPGKLGVKRRQKTLSREKWIDKVWQNFGGQNSRCEREMPNF